MNIAIDTNCILPGRVGGIENYTLGLIEALKLPQSPASRLLLVTRAENHALFAPYADDVTTVHRLERPTYEGQPIGNWADLVARDPIAGRKAMEAFALQKADLLRRSGVELVQPVGYAMTVRAGAITAARTYRTHAQALKAAGLSE